MTLNCQVACATKGSVATIRATRKEKITMVQKIVGVGLAFGLLAQFVLGQTAGSASGTIQGAVFTADAGGGRSVLPAAKISSTTRLMSKLRTTTRVNSSLTEDDRKAMDSPFSRKVHHA
jgi:hypothetical protein